MNGSTGPPQASDNLRRVIPGVSTVLALLTLGGVLLLGSLLGPRGTQPLAELAWAAPTLQSFIVLSALAIALLCLARYRALGRAWVLWTGTAFLANGVLGLFYLLSWPGLLSGRAVAAGFSNSASWLFELSFSCIALLPFTVGVRRPERMSSAYSPAAYLVAAVLAALIGLLSLTLESALPTMIVGLQYTPPALGWTTGLALLAALAAALAYRRYLSGEDPMLGFVALFLTIMAFGLLDVVLGGSRYDFWWYGSRILFISAYLSMLFGFLLEGYALFGREKERTQERQALLATVQAQAEELRSQYEGLRTQEKELERLRASEQEAREQAEKAIRIRNEFISIAAHELKTPVTSLWGFSQVLLRRLGKTGTLDPDQVAHALTHIDEQARRLAALIEEVLNVSRLEAGKLELRTEEAEVCPIVEAAIASVRLLHPDRSFPFECRESTRARLDPVRIEQVVVNLLDNAVKFSPKETHVEVDLRTDEGQLVISVRDHGDGIAEEERERIFERFYQAHPENHYGGMGLGLCISREIVRMHGGSITCEAPEGVDLSSGRSTGSLFVVRLPIGPRGEE